MGKLQGIGFSCSTALLRERAYVFITGRRRKELDQAVTAIGSNVTGV
jgi:hypothetical protein